MRTLGVLATALAAMLLLGSCASSSTPTARPSSSPTPTASASAFLGTEQLDGDRLPDGVADTVDVETASSRYQGEWDQREVYLAARSDSSVCVVTGILGQDDSWAAGCGRGNGVVTVELPDGGVIKYLPMATSTTPQGWTRLSTYVYAT